MHVLYDRKYRKYRKYRKCIGCTKEEFKFFKQSSKYSTLLSTTLSYLSGEQRIPSRKNVSLDEMRWLGHRQRRTFCLWNYRVTTAGHTLFYRRNESRLGYVAAASLFVGRYSFRSLPVPRSTPPIRRANSLPIRINA